MVPNSTSSKTILIFGLLCTALNIQAWASNSNNHTDDTEKVLDLAFPLEYGEEFRRPLPNDDSIFETLEDINEPENRKKTLNTIRAVLDETKTPANAKIQALKGKSKHGYTPLSWAAQSNDPRIREWGKKVEAYLLSLPHFASATDISLGIKLKKVAEEGIKRLSQLEESEEEESEEEESSKS